MNRVARALLASALPQPSSALRLRQIEARLWDVSAERHRLAREATRLRDEATRLRLGLGPEDRAEYERLGAAERAR